MSGCSSSTTCPNCGESADLYLDYKPFDMAVIFCINCGLSINPKVEYCSLEELNDYRVENNLPKLKKLPKQEFTQ